MACIIIIIGRGLMPPCRRRLTVTFLPKWQQCLKRALKLWPWKMNTCTLVELINSRISGIGKVNFIRMFRQTAVLVMSNRSALIGASLMPTLSPLINGKRNLFNIYAKDGPSKPNILFPAFPQIAQGTMKIQGVIGVVEYGQR